MLFFLPYEAIASFFILQEIEKNFISLRKKINRKIRILPFVYQIM